MVDVQNSGAAPADPRASAAIKAFPAVRTRTNLPLTIALLVFSDLFVLAAAVMGTAYIRSFQWKDFDLSLYWSLWPALAVCALAFAVLRLYPVVAYSPVEELRRTTLAITALYIALAAATFLLRGAELYSRSIFLISWALSLIAVPLARSLLRWICAGQSWWGVPVVILGAGKTGHLVVRSLLQRPALGLKPVAVLDDDPDKQDTYCGLQNIIKPSGASATCGVPVLGNLELAPTLAREYGLKYAIVAMPGVPHERLLELLERYADTFTHLIVVPDLFGFSSLRVPAKDLGGILGLEMQQQLLLPGPRFAKRFLDIISTVIGGTCMMPLIGLLMLLIKLESRGPVFYGHTRIGRGNTRFKAWKFRSMFLGADEMLAEYLKKHPELRKEWEETHKLKDDPRVTRMGRWLRKTSLDELPQIWNVLMGEMSLVGPRPIVEEEIPKYAGKFSLYLKVRPGITGIWQVSGRNDTTYSQRVELDTYYVRNWSPWLDAYILAQTVSVVIHGRGAY
ncbi:MAG TPA: undecaprenyl-phosphate galactose phosphotransferase WbaP [Planctomycetota bacterium]